MEHLRRLLRFLNGQSILGGILVIIWGLPSHVFNWTAWQAWLPGWITFRDVVLVVGVLLVVDGIFPLWSRFITRGKRKPDTPTIPTYRKGTIDALADIFPNIQWHVPNKFRVRIVGTVEDRPTYLPDAGGNIVRLCLESARQFGDDLAAESTELLFVREVWDRDLARLHPGDLVAVSGYMTNPLEDPLQHLTECHLEAVSYRDDP